MIKDTWRGKSTARFIYYSYKDSPYYSVLVLSVLFSICLVLFFQVVMPQFESWFSIRDESLATRQRIDIIEGNVSFVKNLDQNILEEQRELTLRALPTQKDFGAIIDAVSASSIKSGVSVDDFSFGLGSIATGSAKKKDTGKKHSDYEMTSLTLSIEGSVENVKSFVKEISEKLPISNVQSVDYKNEKSTIVLVFYSKLFSPPKVKAEEPLLPISAEDSEVINKLSAWYESAQNDASKVPPARSDSVPIF